MEVMNSAELTQTDILVGRKSTTRSFGVSDDPMLMSMLSTGFYQNPLRTMIQEVMFNAWDAHRMGNCQHRPIDIYINDTTGLIIRDYGPGIEPGENDDNMHDIYCMYGGSTKRGQKNQTGGFGLGSKSPFAYTESFTVTSHFGGMKNMYLISRVSDSNGGKPGMTSLVRVPTTETGLMVTVPLKAGHMDKAYEYVKDILFLSGIKAMVHNADEPDKFVDSLHLPAGSYMVDDEHQNGYVWAVYGGVRYRIMKDDEYAQEYEFMNLLGNGKDIFVGFAPDTLTPLPNREGLNMGEKSKESVKGTFERCTEKFQATFKPAAKTALKHLFEYQKARGIQAHFAFIKVGYFGFFQNAQDIRNYMIPKIMETRPDGIDEDVWKIAAQLIVNQTTSIRSYIGAESWKTMFLRAFIEAYPNNKDLAWMALQNKDMLMTNRSGEVKDFITEIYAHRFLHDQMTFIREMQKAFPNDDALHPQMRLAHGDDFETVIQERTKANLDKTKYGFAGLKPEDPRLKRKDARFNDLQRIWKRKSGEELSFLMMDKMILIAKTLATLKDSSIPSVVSTNNACLEQSWRYQNNVSCLIPGYVVYERKGAYEKAVEILTNRGFTVVEGTEPEKKVYLPKVKTVPTYSRLQPGNSGSWQSQNPNDQYPDPTHFFYATLATIRGYSSSERPDLGLVYWFLKKNPKTVTVTNTKVAESLIKQGAFPLHEGVIQWYDTVSANKDRMMNIIRAYQIALLAALPDNMLRHPLMQLELGMEPVDPKDEDFWYESKGYNLLVSADYYPLKTLKKKVKDELEQLWKIDPKRQNIETMCRMTKIFGNSNAVSSLWSSTEPADHDAMVNKIIAAMKLLH
jgi:hypothetical protein